MTAVEVEETASCLFRCFEIKRIEEIPDYFAERIIERYKSVFGLLFEL